MLGLKRFRTLVKSAGWGGGNPTLEFALIGMDMSREKKTFNFLLKSICCGYTLEASKDVSNEQHNKCFHVEIRQISLFFSSLKERLFLCHEFGS